MVKKKVVAKKKTTKVKSRAKQLTDFHFDQKYNPDQSFNSSNFDTGEGHSDGKLETYGRDFARMKRILKKTPKRVWTVVEGDSGALYISAGYHFVNRLYYLITQEDYTHCSELYKISGS